MFLQFDIEYNTCQLKAPQVYICDVPIVEGIYWHLKKINLLNIMLIISIKSMITCLPCFYVCH